MTTPRKIPTFFYEWPNQTPPKIDIDLYRLLVGGAVERSLELSLDGLQHLLPHITTKRRFYCVNGFSLSAAWGGYRLADLMDLAKPDPSYKFLRATSLGGFEDTTSLQTLIDGDAMLITEMDGVPLLPKRGSPLRLMLWNLYQFKGVKGLARLEVVAEYRPGTWERYGYEDATIQPYPHLAIDLDQNVMPEPDVLLSSAAVCSPAP